MNIRKICMQSVIAFLCVPIHASELQLFDFEGALSSGFETKNFLIPSVPEINKGYIADNDTSAQAGPEIPIEWVTIPGGRFLMGTEDFSDTKPVHEVSLKTFEISKALVTVEQYAECVRIKKCDIPARNTSSYNSGFGTCNWWNPTRRKHPVNCVTYKQANQYAEFMGGRLPTEAEWEYAATGGGKNQKYPWGNAKPTEKHIHLVSTYEDDETVPVCERPVGNTLHGLCDMTGNVRQWIQDNYSGGYANAPIDGAAFVDTGMMPQARVLRGAPLSSGLSEYAHRVDYRSPFGGWTGDAEYGYRAEIGFRLAKDVKPASAIEWVAIPGGKFKMGTSGFVPGFEDTKPAHDVSVKSFEMSKTDVTVAQYMECFSKGKCAEPDRGDACNWGTPGRQEHPINCVDWNQANQYAEFAGARLPTEAEWEYAARSGGKDNMYPWGNSIPTGETLVMKSQATAPVCSRPAGNTEQGLCDMGGNVFQWVQDTYQKSYDGVPVDGTASEIGGPLRVLRGSPFNNAQEFMLRSVYRFATAPGYRYDIFGFRLARSR